MMKSKLRDALSCAMMSVLIFIALTLSHTSLTGSSGAGIRYLHLHWIVVRQDAWKISVMPIQGGTLVAFVAAAFGVTWAMSHAFAALRRKQSTTGWLLLLLVVLIYLAIVGVQDVVLT